MSTIVQIFSGIHKFSDFLIPLTQYIALLMFLLISGYVFVVSKKDTGILFDYLITAVVLGVFMLL